MGTARQAARFARPAATLALALVVGLVGFVLAGCGGTKFAPEPPPAAAPSATIKPSDPGPVKITVQNANDIKARPFVKVNTGALPDQLQTTDLIPGTGREAKATDTVTVQYVAVIARSGQEFAASWDNNAPEQLQLPNTVPGFRSGVAGMKEGGRREIVIPPNQAYGSQGFDSLVGPNEHLIYIVDLVKIDS